MECVALSPASSHFITDGLYTSFQIWRFIFRARSKTIPLNGAMTWKQGHDRTCRMGCDHIESLAHVICHCLIHSRALQLRHNALVGRVKTAIGQIVQIMYETQRVPNSNLRPDLVVAYKSEIYIIDVTVTFEDGKDSFDRAREKKHLAYANIIKTFKTPTNTAEIIPFVMGALGYWDPQNDYFMKKFVSRSYLTKFRKLCTCDTIKWSRDIYAEHVTGIRQYDPTELNISTQRPHESETETNEEAMERRPANNN
ncbi:hypothetical protein AVEN_14022-1 [Araneus ventricosus]|uniref:Uncharacterized protein n=1 Tax=Araneus ventricosus TaxID=182803 RepID=A0A4Y2N2N4_ARAVE|nr:hypothetical protein AVEN_14022-1 [Araneus ventricosus]